MKLNKIFALLSTLVIVMSMIGILPAGGDGTQTEFPAQEDEFTDAYNGIIDRSLSTGVGHGASVNSGKKAKSNPQLKTSFEGLNHYQQRYTRGGNLDVRLCIVHLPHRGDAQHPVEVAMWIADPDLR